MDTIWSRKADEILKIGHPLNKVGVRNWALTKSDALAALEQFLRCHIPILGGDVYEEINGTIQSNYDSWHCDALPGETKNDFLIRSITKAKTYIEEYRATPSDRVFFAFVPDV